MADKTPPTDGPFPFIADDENLRQLAATFLGGPVCPFFGSGFSQTTSTVNVPREWLERVRLALVAANNPSAFALSQDAEALLAAGRNAGGFANPSLDPVGTQGGEAVIPQGQPSAPKVEQEPFGYVSEDEVHLLREHGMLIHVCDEKTANPNERNYTIPVYTHPAPASDELLEALALIERFRKDYNPYQDDQLEEDAEEFIAKHKGPQS